jgi:hypothetical protein
LLRLRKVHRELAFNITQVKIIRRLVIGYPLIFFTPVLSLLLHFGLLAWAVQQQNYLIPVIVHSAINVAVIAVLIVGIVLYYLEYTKNQMKEVDDKITFVLSPLLILWGIIVTFIAYGFYQDLMQWSRMREVRALTAWDYLEYGSWILKGILWMISGILLIITSIRNEIKKHKR